MCILCWIFSSLQMHRLKKKNYLRTGKEISPTVEFCIPSSCHVVQDVLVEEGRSIHIVTMATAAVQSQRISRCKAKTKTTETYCIIRSRSDSTGEDYVLIRHMERKEFLKNNFYLCVWNDMILSCHKQPRVVWLMYISDLKRDIEKYHKHTLWQTKQSTFWHIFGSHERTTHSYPSR